MPNTLLPLEKDKAHQINFGHADGLEFGSEVAQVTARTDGWNLAGIGGYLRDYYEMASIAFGPFFSFTTKSNQSKQYHFFL